MRGEAGTTSTTNDDEKMKPSGRRTGYEKERRERERDKKRESSSYQLRLIGF